MVKYVNMKNSNYLITINENTLFCGFETQTRELKVSWYWVNYAVLLVVPQALKK